MPENKEVKSKRDALLERMKGKYPDKSFDDDEALYGQIGDDYDAYDKEINTMKDREGKFARMFGKDPRSARLMMDWKDGQDPAIGLIRLYGEDIIDAINDPEKQEEIAAANKEYMDRVSQEEEYSKQYETNLAQSLEELSKIQQEQGLSDVEIDETMSELMTIVKDAILGKFSRSTIEMMLKGKSHDNDVATASNEGEIRGRNQRIEEKLRKPQDGDGTKVLDGMNTQAPQRVKRRTIFDDAREAQ
jgi:hypothetical protein